MPQYRADAPPPQQKENDLAEPEEEDVAEPVLETKGHEDEAIAQLQKQLEEVTAFATQAEEETTRVRTIFQRDSARASEAGTDKFVKKLFPMCDTLDICLQHKPDFSSEQHKNNALAQKAFEGITEAKAKLVACFEEKGIEEVRPSLGDGFDPNFHDALFEMEAPADGSAKAGTIGLVLKVGWKRGTSILRPATVGVVRKS